MQRVAVVADTTCYLPEQLARAEGIHRVSLYVNWDGARSQPEAELDSLAAFYDELRSSERLPTTSQPSPGDFLAVYEPLLTDGLDVVSVHISSGLSGTSAAAAGAATLLDGGADRVTVIDSNTAAGGLGLVVLAAARRAAAGADAAGVAGAAREARDVVEQWACLDTLEYLRRGGRIGAASAWVGSTFGIKPIVTVQGEITPVERVRSAPRAMDRMVAYARECHASGADGWMVQHIQAPDQAAQLTERCREVFHTEPAYVSEVGPVLGVHTGPGLLGLAALPLGLLG